MVDCDARTKWLEAIRIGLITADATIEALRTIWATHGLPEQIVSDNGPPYSSAAFNQYCQSRGITHTTIAPYKPQSNGCAERAVRTFKEGVKRMQDEGFKQNNAVRQFLLRYRVTPHPATGLSPAEMMFQRRIRTLLDVSHPNPNLQKGEEKKEVQKRYMERTKRNYDHGKIKEKRFGIGDNIYARNYAEGNKWVPGRITQQIGRAMFLVKTERGTWKRHLDQLKRNVSDADYESDTESETSELFVPRENNRKFGPERQDSAEGNSDENQREVYATPPQAYAALPPIMPLRRTARVPKPRKIFDPSKP